MGQIIHPRLLPLVARPEVAEEAEGRIQCLSMYSRTPVGDLGPLAAQGGAEVTQ